MELTSTIFYFFEIKTGADINNLIIYHSIVINIVFYFYFHIFIENLWLHNHKKLSFLF